MFRGTRVWCVGASRVRRLWARGRAQVWLAVARACVLTPEGARRVFSGGLLHDGGKIALPDWLLRKPGPLNAREWEAMATHPERGALLLSDVDDVRDAAPIVAAHHE